VIPLNLLAKKAKSQMRKPVPVKPVMRCVIRMVLIVDATQRLHRRHAPKAVKAASRVKRAKHRIVLLKAILPEPVSASNLGKRRNVITPSALPAMKRKEEVVPAVAAKMKPVFAFHRGTRIRVVSTAAVPVRWEKRQNVQTMAIVSVSSPKNR